MIMMWLLLLGCENHKKLEKKEITTENITSKPLFSLLTSEETGIQFVNKNSESDYFNFYTYEYFYNGGGVAVADFNNDGLQDIYFTANKSPNKLYVNLGNLKFKDITSTANINSVDRDWCTGVTIVDINNDGWQDIFVSRSGWFKNESKHLLRNLLFVNNHDLTFTERGEEYGFTDLSPTIQTCFFDSDNDGDLDVYQINHPTIFKTFKQYSNGEIVKVESKDHYFSDKFYENINGKFVDKTKILGFENSGHGLGVISSDFNNDGWQDLYISNDYLEPDYIYINQKNGLFKNEALTAFKHISKFSMGVDVADINNDGLQDIFNAEMLAKDNFSKKTSMAPMNPKEYMFLVDNGYHHQDMHNSLQLNNGNGTFSEISWLSNIAETDWSWSPLFADFDNDGFKDLFVSNGYKRDMLSKDFSNMLKKQMEVSGTKRFSEFENLIPSKKVSNYIFKNNKDLTFTDKTNEWGIQFDVNSNGAAYADLDNDGDLDLIINNVDEEATILKNNSDKLFKNHYIKLEFKGLPRNTKGIGVKVRVYTDHGIQVFDNYCVRGYQSSIPPQINIGIAKHTKIDSLVVYWPLGKKQQINITELDKLYIVDYSQAILPEPNDKNSIKKTLFLPYVISPQLKHIENDFDDYQFQVLLPHKLSQFGPAIAVGDINNDGLDDLYLGQSTGTASEIFIQNNKGEFIKKQAFTEDIMYEDIDATFFDFDNDGDLDLYVASGGNEFKINSSYYADRLYENRNGEFINRSDLLPKNIHISSSRIVVHDINNDGFKDLFVCGRLSPHDYPAPTSSYILMNEKGIFKDVSETIAPELKNIGMVTDASFTDYDNDGDTDILIVGEWMPPTFFENKEGKYRKVINKTLDSLSGWYNTIKSIDIDKDGDEDYIVGNLGENYKYKANSKEPFEMFYDDFDKNGSNDIILGYYNFGELFPVRGKSCSTQQIPNIKKISHTYDIFGKSTVSDLYGSNNLEVSLHLSSYNFKSGVLKNNGNGNFEFIPFPDIAQLSSINDILIKDINKDGKDDLIIAGNLFTSEIETPRNDAGYGMVLINKGNFKFVPMEAAQSGLFLPYDVKNLNWLKGKNNILLISGNNNDLLRSFKIRQ